MNRRCGVFILSVALSFAARPAFAQSTATPPKLPPGMTPAIFKMITTPLPGHPDLLPVDVVPFQGCVPTMGYHYANPKNWPTGPIYGYYNGRPVFSEAMIAKTAFESGKSWDDIIKPLPGYAIDHIDIWYEAHGHPGFWEPHYDVHAWYVSHAEHMTYCNNPSGKKPPYL